MRPSLNDEMITTGPSSSQHQRPKERDVTGQPETIKVTATITVELTALQLHDYRFSYGVEGGGAEIANRLRPELTEAMTQAIWLRWLIEHATVTISSPQVAEEFVFAEPLSNSQRWQVREARDLLALWDQNRGGPDVYGTERTLADQVRTLLAIIDQVAPAEPPKEPSS